MQESSRPSVADRTTAAARPVEWLDRYPWLPFVLLLSLPWIVHLPPWLLGLSTDPIWNFSGVTDGSRIGVFVGLPSADPNAGWTTETVGRLAALDWVHGVVPWWDPYAGIGMPLAGEMQPAAFFLPFVLLLLLQGGVLWLGIAVETLAGLAAYALCRELRLGRLAAVSGAALYALNGTLAWFAHAPAFPVPFLPLLLFGIERARRPGAAGIFWTGIAIAWLVLAGFPETAYIGGLFSLLWAGFRFFSPAPGRLAFAARVAAGGLLGLLLALPQLIAFIDDLGQSRIVSQHGMGAISLSWHGFPAFLMPYVYGPLTQFWGNSKLWVIWGLIGGYSGVVLLLLAVRGGRGRSDQGLRFLLLGWVVLAWAKTFAVPPVQELMNRIPFLLQVNFARYAAPSWELALILLAAFALDDLAHERPRLGLPFLAVLALLGLAVSLAWPGDPFFAWQGEMLTRMSGLIRLAFAIAAGFLVCSLAVWLLFRGTTRRTLLAGLAVAEAMLLFVAPELNGLHPGRIDRPGIRFLADHLGLDRFYTTGPLQPNYGGYFGIASINHAAAPVPARWSDYVASKLAAPFAGIIGETFWSGMLSDPTLGTKELLRNLANYEAVGVRYVLTDPGQVPQPTVLLPAGTSGNRPLLLAAGAAATASFPAPAPPPGAHLLTAVGVLIGNDFNTADGSLSFRLCDPSRCSAGSRPLAGSADNHLFFVPLEHPREFTSGAPLRLQIRHEGGTKPVALWLWPAIAGANQTVEGPASPLPGQAFRLALRYQDAAFPFSEVYSDPVMTIWELPHPLPYFSVGRGGPCVLHVASRRSVGAECVAAATLIRRELFMPGWSARVNGVPAALQPFGDILQSVPLPPGTSAVRFRFAPPGIHYGWIGAAVGLLGLFCALAAMLRADGRSPPADAGGGSGRFNRAVGIAARKGAA